MKTAEETAIQLLAIFHNSSTEHAQEYWKNMTDSLKSGWLRLAEYGMMKHTDARISALEEAAHVVLIATRIPEGARNPTRDFLVIKGEEISNLILSLATKLKEGKE